MTDYGTYKGQVIDESFVDDSAVEFERDWAFDEIVHERTAYAKTLRALEDLMIPTDEIVALEHRARSKETPFVVYIRSIIKEELLGAAS